MGEAGEGHARSCGDYTLRGAGNSVSGGGRGKGGSGKGRKLERSTPDRRGAQVWWRVQHEEPSEKSWSICEGGGSERTWHKEMPTAGGV